WREPHFLDTAGGAHEEGFGSAKEQRQAFFFHRRMEPADYRDSGIANVTNQVVGPQDHVAGALYPAEESERPALQKVQVADCGDRQGFAESLLNAIRVQRVACRNHRGVHNGEWPSLVPSLAGILRVGLEIIGAAILNERDDQLIQNFRPPPSFFRHRDTETQRKSDLCVSVAKSGFLGLATGLPHSSAGSPGRCAPSCIAPRVAWRAAIWGRGPFRCLP